MHRQSAAKEQLRKRLLEARRRMSFEDVYRASSRIQKRFVESPYFSRARRVALYSSFANEPLTDEIFIRAAKLGKEVFYPRVIKGMKHLEFHRVISMDELAPGSYEILEPAQKDTAQDPASFDLIAVPGVAFDRNGARIGYGKGYYDRALTEARCPIVALAYEFQVIGGMIPAEGHDVNVTAIFTEKRTITARQDAAKSC